MCSAPLPLFLFLMILVYFISLENPTKKGNYPDGIQIFTCDAKSNVDLKKKFHSWYFDQKICLKELAVTVFIVRGISFIKDFRAVNTQRSTLNFAHTVLTGCFTKACPRFF